MSGGGGGALGAAIGAGASLIGANKSRSSARRANETNEAIAAEDRALQREFATKGVQWRVQDAKEAGLHPLFALSSGVPSYSSPTRVGAIPVDTGQGIRGAGQAIQRAISAQKSPEERAYETANLDLLKAKTGTETTMQAYYASLAARNHQELNASKAVPTSQDPTSVMPDVIESKPSEIISHSSKFPASVAGTRPILVEYTHPTIQGAKIMLPYSEEGPSEALSELPLTLWPMIIDANKKRYGSSWKSGLLKSLLPYRKGKYSTQGKRRRGEAKHNYLDRLNIPEKWR